MGLLLGRSAFDAQRHATAASLKTPGSQKGGQNRAETAVMATILTRLCVAIDSVEETWQRPVRLCLLAPIFVMPALHLLSQDGGSGCYSPPDAFLSRFVPDLRAIMAWLRT
jgi:hypothetical protein